MSAAEPLARVAVGVVVERRNAKSPWADFIWRPSAVLAGAPDAVPWTLLDAEPDRATYYAGAAQIALYRSDTELYRDNLAAGEPMLWAVLRPTGTEPPFTVVAVTADPSEGEAFATVGTDLVEALPMPGPIRDAIEAFIAAHHVEPVPFNKRELDHADPEALARGARVKGPS